MQHHPLKRRRSTSSINDSDLPRRKCVRSVLNELQRTAEEVRCALNSANWLSVKERVRAALIIDHVAGMSMMMGRDYEFGDGDEEMEEDGDGGENGKEHLGGDDKGDSGVITEDVANDGLDTPFVEDSSGSLQEKDENEGSGEEEGGDRNGDNGGEEADEEFYSSWIRRGVSFSADAMCTACTEKGGN